jgi:hypothetical protein
MLVTMFSHFSDVILCCYNVQPFLLSYNAHPFLMLQCSTILRATMFIHFSLSYNAQPFFTELQCSPILVNSVISSAAVLSHFPLSYNIHPFLVLQCSTIFH